MLTDTKLKSLKPRDKPYKLSDSNQLRVHVSTAGTKSFQLDYALEGKRKTLTLGKYPDISLAEARLLADEARKQVAKGFDPHKSPDTCFKSVALDWGKHKVNSWDAKHKNYRRLELYVYPFIGHKKITDINSVEILKLVRLIEKRGTGETAHRVLNVISQVFRYAVACGQCERDVTADLRGALRPVTKSHFNAITDPKELALFLQAVEIYNGNPIVRLCLKVMPHVFVRPGELRMMRWGDIVGDEWRYTVSKTKTQHIVPLSTHVLCLLDLLASYRTCDYVFSLNDNRAISDTTLLMAIRRMGFDLTVHGFRATARTLLDEVLRFPPHLIEHQLAHVVRDPLGRAYNRTQHLDDRKVMMERWGDYILSLI